MREGLKNYQIHQPGYYWNKTCMIWGSSGIYSFVIRMSSGKLKNIPLFASLKCWLDRFVANSFLNIYTIHKNPVILVGKPSKKKTSKLWTLSKLLKPPPPIRGGLDSKSLDIMKLSWPPHPLEKFGHFGNKKLAFKKAYILLRLKAVCLYRQVELVVYTSTLHFRASCDNVTMNQEFLQFVPFLSCF